MPKAERQLRILTSNRLEVLVEALAEDLRQAPLPPFASETIIIQSPGMRRWLTLELARRLGCAASLSTPFPSRFCADLAQRLVGGAPQAGEPFARDSLAWRLFARLSQPLTGPDLAPLASYLRRDDQMRRWQLAQRIADRFDEYQLYRGELLRGWEAGQTAMGEHAAWQATLWRELVNSTPQPHLARRLHDAIHRLETMDSEPPGLPARLTAFAVGSLPPVFLDLLRALARHRPVTIHLLAPTPHFWSDLRSPREQRRNTEPSPIGNALLAGFARQGRELATLLQQRDDTGQAWEELAFSDPGTDSALHVLQHDLFDVLERGTEDTPALRLASSDVSLTIHACHSPLRELEVVRDQLYAAFAADPSLTPDQVLVLVTDLARYAPLATTVLGAHRDGVALPVRLADRGHDSDEQAIRALLAVLRLADARLTAPEVCGLLELEPLRQAAAINRDELPTVRSWIVATNIRWGADSLSRSARSDLPVFPGNAWRDGLDRLITGVASGGYEGLIAGIAPLAGDSAGSADLIGRLACWFDSLSAALAGLQRARPLAQWAIDLPRLIDALLAGDEEATIAMRAQVADRLAAAALHGEDQPVELAVVRDLLSAAFAEAPQAGAFLWGGITIAALKPLRTIPAAVIAICGLDDGRFPRQASAPAFDLIAAHPQIGDRRVRDEDRQVLLDTLLAARERIILTYVGRSQVDDAPLPPSVCVAELLDWCDAAFTTEDGRPARDHLVLNHPLQPFSQRHGDGSDPRLFTYGPLAPAHSCVAPTAFLDRPLPLPTADLSFTWSELADAWANPSRHFCRHALELRLTTDSDPLAEHEPLDLDGLAGFHLRTWIAERLRVGATTEQLRPLAEAQGVLPVGRLGDAAFANACQEAAQVIARLGASLPAPPVVLDLHGEGWRLGGVLDRCTDAGLLFWRAGALREQDLLQAWVAHLALQDDQDTRLVGLDRSLRFHPVTEASAILADLACGYRDGLTRPLPLFLRAGHAYFSQVRKPGKIAPLDKARQAWSGNDFTPGADREDPYTARCWNHLEQPLDAHRDEFIALAHRLWEPLFDALEEET